MWECSSMNDLFEYLFILIICVYFFILLKLLSNYVLDIVKIWYIEIIGVINFLKFL